MSCDTIANNSPRITSTPPPTRDNSPMNSSEQHNDLLAIGKQLENKLLKEETDTSTSSSPVSDKKDFCWTDLTDDNHQETTVEEHDETTTEEQKTILEDEKEDTNSDSQDVSSTEDNNQESDQVTENSESDEETEKSESEEGNEYNTDSDEYSSDYDSSKRKHRRSIVRGTNPDFPPAITNMFYLLMLAYLFQLFFSLCDRINKCDCKL